jgi:hypothetical protein
MGPERSSRSLKSKSSNVQGNKLFRKQECLSLIPKHLTVIPSSLHAILFRKTKEILNPLMQRRYESKGNRNIEAATVRGATRLEIVMGCVRMHYYHFVCRPAGCNL